MRVLTERGFPGAQRPGWWMYKSQRCGGGFAGCRSGEMGIGHEPRVALLMVIEADGPDHASLEVCLFRACQRDPMSLADPTKA